MTDDEQQRIIDFLQRKQCGPCRRGSVDRGHVGCAEAQDLIRVIEREPATDRRWRGLRSSSAS